MRRASAFPPLVALLAVFASNSRAQEEARIRAANLLRGYYDTNVEESVVDNRLDVDLGYKALSAGIVFLSHTPSDYLRLDPNKYGPHKEGIRKRWVTAAHGPFEVRLGDSYATFGSGLVLRILEDQSVEFDNAVDGIYLEAASSRFVIEGIAGTNRFGEANLTVKGLSARFEPGAGWMLGVNGAMIDSLNAGEASPGRDQIAGVQGSAGLPGGIDVNAEYAVLRHKPEEAGRLGPPEGHGAYAAARKSIGPVSITIEGKDLLRFRHPYVIPPTAVRQHTSTLLNRGSHVPNIRIDDERGFQSEVLWSLSPDVMLTGNWSRSEARHASLPASEFFGQVEATWAGVHWVGYAAETEETLPETAAGMFFERITAGGSASGLIGRGWGLELGYETQGTQRQDLALYRYPVEFRDQVASITVSKSPVHSLGVTMEWTNDPLETRDSWTWLEWNIRLGRLGQLSFAGGRLRGGQVCSGGICRVLDPFAGGKVELLANF